MLQERKADIQQQSKDQQHYPRSDQRLLRVFAQLHGTHGDVGGQRPHALEQAFRHFRASAHHHDDRHGFAQGSAYRQNHPRSDPALCRRQNDFEGCLRFCGTQSQRPFIVAYRYGGKGIQAYADHGG